MRKPDFFALGYRGVEHGGFSWLGNEEGARFLSGVHDWSPQGLAARREWTSWKRHYHTLYLAKDREGKMYLIKAYPPKKNRERQFSRKPSRAKKEFCNTLIAYKKDVQTVLPLAIGEGKQNGQWGVIIYPFLDTAVSLTRVYTHEGLERLTVQERQSLEKTVGRLVRKFIDKGMVPRDLGLDHFLARKESGEILVHWVDLERVKFTRLFKRRKGIETLGKLLAQMEWLRNSGWNISRSSMMRIGHAYFHKEGLRGLDKRLCWEVIQAAGRVWLRRSLSVRRPPPVTIVDLSGKECRA